MSGLIGLTVFSWFQSSRDKRVTEKAYGINLSLEIIGFSLLIYLSGGATNPFVFYYLVPLSIGVATLSKGHAWILCCLSIGVYTLLLFQYHPLPLFDMSHGMTVSWKSPHILGMWMNFIVSALLITYFVSRMADQIRSQERELANHSQRQREDEHLLAMGTFAAGTAHELGTPLSSLAVILQDLSGDQGICEELRTELRVACGEVARCKDILHRLVTAAQTSQNSNRRQRPVGELLEQLRYQVKNLFPAAEIALQIDTSLQIRSLPSDTALEQSLLNLLVNAVEASLEQGESRIEVQAVSGDAENHKVLIRVRDFGSGVADEILAKLGKVLVSGKAEGLGMGYFLANASINRIGGKLSIQNLASGGAETLVELPLSPYSGEVEI